MRKDRFVMKKLVAGILTASLCVSLLAGCGGASSSAPGTAGTSGSAAGTAAPDVTLTTASMFGGTDPHVAPYMQIMDEFMAEYPNVTIEDESRAVDETWRASIINDFNSGNAPDVLYYVHCADGQAVVDTGGVVDVDTIIAEYPEYAANIDPNAMNAVKTNDGKAYCVPMKGYWEGLFCNTALFEQYGVKIPETWEELLTAVETFRANGIVPFSLSLSDIPHYIIEYMFLANGGVESLRERPKAGDEIPESWIKGLETLKELYDLGAFPDDVLSTTDATTNLLFNEGKSAMLVTGSWYPGQIPVSDDTGTLVTQDQVTIVPFPGKADATGTPGIVAGWSGGFYISKQAWEDPVKRDYCVKLVMAHTSTRGIETYCGPELGGVPADTSVPMQGEGPLVTVGNDYWQANNANTADPACDHMNADPKNILYQGLAKICTGDTTPEELLRTVIDKGAY